MEKILIIILRSELNYLIKYNELKISLERIINLSYQEFEQLPETKKSSLLYDSLPIYEQDHEVLLLEYDNSLITYNHGISIEFRGIYSLIPLTEMGAKLLASKLNSDFRISQHLNIGTYQLFLSKRNHNLRLRSAKNLSALYLVSLPDRNFINDFVTATEFQIRGLHPSTNNTTLSHLIDFNVTPSFIPQGNIEGIIKSGCVAMKKVDINVNQITKSIFYSSVIKNKEQINSLSLYNAIVFVEREMEQNEEGREKFSLLKKTLNDGGKYEDAFMLFSYFYQLKKVIEQNNYDVSAARDEILELKFYNSLAASKVLFMLGYTFSIQTISQSIQSFSTSPLLQSKKALNLEWSPQIVLDENVPQSKLQTTATSHKKLNSDSPSLYVSRNFVPEDKDIPKVDLQEQKQFQIINKEQEEEKSVAIDLSVEPTIESKIGKNLERIGNFSTERNDIVDYPANSQEQFTAKEKVDDVDYISEKTILQLKNKEVEKRNLDDQREDLFSTQSLDKEIAAEHATIFSYGSFKRHVGGGKAYEALVQCLKNKEINEKEISADVIKSCLLASDYYSKKNGDLNAKGKICLSYFQIS